VIYLNSSALQLVRAEAKTTALLEWLGRWPRPHGYQRTRQGRGFRAARRLGGQVVVKARAVVGASTWYPSIAWCRLRLPHRPFCAADPRRVVTWRRRCCSARRRSQGGRVCAGLSPALSVSALGGIRTPNLLIRSRVEPVLGGPGSSHGVRVFAGQSRFLPSTRFIACQPVSTGL
jgi:hypothetical protein